MLTRCKTYERLNSETTYCNTLPDDVNESFVERKGEKVKEKDCAECSRMHFEDHPLPACVCSHVTCEDYNPRSSVSVL